MKLEPFSAILSDCTSKYNKIKKENYLPKGQFPIIDQGQKFVGGYTDDGGLITDSEKELIIFGDHTKILKFIDFPIAIGADGVKVLHINTEKADPRYIYYFLKSVKLTDAGYSRHFKFLKEIKIPVPENINEQIKVARLLNHVETLIAQRKESIELLDDLLKNTFLQMFGDYFSEDYLTKLNDLCHKITDGTHDTPDRLNEGVKFITGKHIRPFIIDYENSDYVTTEVHEEIYKRCNPEFGDVLYTNIGVNLGTAAMNVVGYEFSMKNVALLKPKKEKINSRYLEHILNNERQKNKIINDNSSGGAQKFLSLGQIKSIKIPVPKIEFQNKFAIIVEKVEVLKKQYKASLKELENMYEVLSQKAFTDKIQRDKKKSDELMVENPNEDFNFEKYLKEMEVSKKNKEKRDITNMSFAEYLEFPEELQMSHEKWMFDFLDEDEFYQFLLKDGFKDNSFTLGDLETKFHNLFYHGGDMDFDNEKWKQILFKFLEANPPLIEQFFEEETATIKLRLTDEAYKA